MFKDHPRGLLPAALSNMGERFGYYIMNAVLVLFLCSKFGLSDAKATLIYSFFYAGIYVLSLVGGLIADARQNYKGTIMTGLIIMAAGYVVLSIPIMADAGNTSWLLTLTCVALFFIAFGNGLFKGNLQAIVGQMYDNLEAEAATKGDAELKVARSKRDAGFQIFYVFINIGGLIAPFVAPLLRSWWLGEHGLSYNAELPRYCHMFLQNAVEGQDLMNMQALVAKVSQVVPTDLAEFSRHYLNVFNTGIHYSFIASVAAMLLSLVIFIATRKGLPNPAPKAKQVVSDYTPEERTAMAKEIRQRIFALLAVLGVAVFFWLAFHQNGTSLSLYARDFVNTKAVAPEIWQAVNPFFVIVLTPIIIMIFSGFARKGKEISTPKKIAIGMGIAAIAYLFLTIHSYNAGYPSATDFRALSVEQSEPMKAGPWVMLVIYFFLTVAELFISPLGLSFVSKVAPKHLLGLCQGLWLTATALGNLLLWIGPVLYNALPIWQCWLIFMIVCLIPMGVMLAMVRWLERVTK